MARYVINGGKTLQGTVTISGAKNAALAILPAVLLVDGQCRIENVPDISDVHILLDILKNMGAEVTEEGSVVTIDCSPVRSTCPDAALVRKMRASYYLMGALLGRFGQGQRGPARRVQLCLPAHRPAHQGLPGPGGRCGRIRRLCGFAAGVGGLHGGKVSLDVVSVGATVNIMLAATLLPGQTIIENAAKEPHIVDLANFLNTMGARVSGAGTDTVKIRGVRSLKGGTYAIIPDQIEAGTYMAAVTAARGQYPGAECHSKAHGLHHHQAAGNGCQDHQLRRCHPGGSAPCPPVHHRQDPALSRIPHGYAGPGLCVHGLGLRCQPVDRKRV